MKKGVENRNLSKNFSELQYLMKFKNEEVKKMEAVCKKDYVKEIDKLI